MDYFRKYLGADDTDEIESGLETIEKLVDRISTSSLIDDRRDALRALKSLSRKFRLEVGTQALYPILKLLENDKDDAEISYYALETLYNIMCEDMGTDEIETNRLVNIPVGLGIQFTEMFINKPNNLELVLQFTEDTDFSVRRISIQLLHNCLTNMQKETQEVILKCPMAISKIIDLLSDPNEVIRNDSLILLIDLVKSNCNIQKIVAFENAYESLLNIISDEGDSDGGVIVEDCLKIILSLIENNPQNQTLFKEGSYIKRLSPFFNFADETQKETESDKGWSPQKLANVQLMLQIIRSLVSPHNKAQATAQCQASIRICGLFQKICDILMSSGIPPQLLTETILTVAEAMRGCLVSQELFANLMAPSEPPQPAINVLLLSMVNESQSFVLRCAALYCFQCFLYKNPTGQSYVIQTLLPKSSISSRSSNSICSDNYSSGKLLCVGLFAPHPLSVWFAAVSLMHCVNNNSSLKEDLLKVQLATTDNSTYPISFLQKCCLLLSQGVRPQAKIGILMLLCTWLAYCPNAISKFLPSTESSSNSRSNSNRSSPDANNQQRNSHQNSQMGNNLSLLISELSGVDNDENEVIIRGLCALLIGICMRFNSASLHHQELGMDKKTILQIVERRLGKDILIEHLNHITKTEAYTNTMRHLQPSFDKTSDVLFDYEFTRLFRSLEHEIIKLIQEESESHPKDSKNISHFTDHEKIVFQYKDLIKSQDEELKRLKEKVTHITDEQTKSNRIIQTLQEELQISKDQCSLLKANRNTCNSSTNSLPVLTVSDVTKQNCSNSAENKVLQCELNTVKLQLDQSNQKHAEELDLLKKELMDMTAKEIQSKVELQKLTEKCVELSDRLKSSQMESEAKYQKLLNEHETLKNEHDDLLVLLSDQEENIKELRAKLGIEVSDNEDNEYDDVID